MSEWPLLQRKTAGLSHDLVVLLFFSLSVIHHLTGPFYIIRRFVVDRPLEEQDRIFSSSTKICVSRAPFYFLPSHSIFIPLYFLDNPFGFFP